MLVPVHGLPDEPSVKQVLIVTTCDATPTKVCPFVGFPVPATTALSDVECGFLKSAKDSIIAVLNVASVVLAPQVAPLVLAINFALSSPFTTHFCNSLATYFTTAAWLDFEADFFAPEV